jgi:L-cystine transport system ATP-binding protein
MTTPSLLQASGLRKTFGDNVVLDGVDLDVPEGTTTAIIGPSGSGKTTLLRSLNALTVPDAGTVSIGDVSVDFGSLPRGKEGRRACERLRAQSGMVFQSHELFPHRTVLGNLVEGPVQVGGQQQRVGIARALALRPRVVLLDEPTSALDPELVGEVLAVVRDLASQGWTMVVVTHEIRFAADVADTVVFVDGGHVVERGPARDVVDAPQHERTQRFLERVLHPG